MALRKVRKKLSEEQKAIGIVFTSTLSKQRFETTEDTTHEVFREDEDKDKQIERLEDDSFFRNSPWNFNIIRT